MDIAITIVHIVACFILIGVVLLQTGKGADVGAVFGGSSQTVFGSSGAGNLLTRLTTGTAILFMITSLGLTWWSTRSLSLSVADSVAPSEPPPLAAPLEPAPLGADEVAEPVSEPVPATAEAGLEAEAASPAAREAAENPTVPAAPAAEDTATAPQS